MYQDRALHIQIIKASWMGMYQDGKFRNVSRQSITYIYHKNLLSSFCPWPSRNVPRQGITYYLYIIKTSWEESTKMEHYTLSIYILMTYKCTKTEQYTDQGKDNRVWCFQRFRSVFSNMSLYYTQKWKASSGCTEDWSG